MKDECVILDDIYFNMCVEYKIHAVNLNKRVHRGEVEERGGSVYCRVL